MLGCHPLTLAYTSSLNRLDLPNGPMSIDSIRSYETEIVSCFSSGESDLRQRCLAHSNMSGAHKADHIGLNTIGMLIDRLSILCIRSYINGSSIFKENSDDINQIRDIEKALSCAQKGTSSSFNKVTTIEDLYLPQDFDEASMMLGATNLLLWLAQDVLYLRGPEYLANEELRKYIMYFAEKNISRNRLIFFSDRFFWDTK